MAKDTAPMLKIPSKLPTNVAQCADLLYMVTHARLELQHKVTKLAEVESKLEGYIIDNLPKSQASGISGRVAHVQITTKVVPRVEDWDKLYAHIKKTKAWDLLQRRINTGAVKERWENQKDIPGVGTFNVVSVSCTAVKK